MTKGKLNPEEFTRNVQEFLFACAYWICAADEELRSEEQDWLIEQFGEKKTAAWLENCMNMESQAFLQHFDAMAHSLDDWQKRQVLPAIIPWLSDCVMADKQLDPAENQVLKEIRARLQLENEIDRLQKPAAKYGKTTGPESKTVNTSDAGAEMLAGQSAMARQVVEETPAFSILQEMGRPTTVRDVADSMTINAVVQVVTAHTEEITSLCALPDGKRFISASLDRTVKVFSLDDTAELLAFDGHRVPVAAVEVAEKQGGVLTADRDGVLIYWNADDGKEIWRTALNRTGGISDISLSPDEKTVALCSMGRRVYLIDMTSGKVSHDYSNKHWSAFRAVSYTPDGQALAVAGDDHSIHIVNPESGRDIKTFHGHSSSVTDLGFNADGSGMVSAARDNTVRLWDFEETAECRRFYGHTFSVYAVAVHPGKPWVLSGSWDHTARLWDMETGESLLKTESQNGRFNSVTFVPRNNKALLGASDNSIYILTIG